MGGHRGVSLSPGKRRSPRIQTPNWGSARLSKGSVHPESQLHTPTLLSRPLHPPIRRARTLFPKGPRRKQGTTEVLPAGRLSRTKNQPLETPDRPRRALPAQCHGSPGSRDLVLTPIVGERVLSSPRPGPGLGEQHPLPGQAQALGAPQERPQSRTMCSEEHDRHRLRDSLQVALKKEATLQ